MYEILKLNLYFYTQLKIIIKIRSLVVYAAMCAGYVIKKKNNPQWYISTFITAWTLYDKNHFIVYIYIYLRIFVNVLKISKLQQQQMNNVGEFLITFVNAKMVALTVKQIPNQVWYIYIRVNRKVWFCVPEDLSNCYFLTYLVLYIIKI